LCFSLRRATAFAKGALVESRLGHVLFYAVTEFLHSATSRKVAGSIPDGVTGIFHGHNLSGRTMALGSTQPLTHMSTRGISWVVKAAGALG
jgi:hypothetical protein